MAPQSDDRPSPFSLRIPPEWEPDLRQATEAYDWSRHKYVLKALRAQLDIDSVRPAHIVYRLFDEAGQLLYIGMTSNLGPRFTTHKHVTEWWPSVATIEATLYPTRDAAAEAETAAIEDDHPLHNVLRGGEGRPLLADAKRFYSMRFSDRAVAWMERQAKRAQKKSWRAWLQDDIEERALADELKSSDQALVVTHKEPVQVNRQRRRT